jgi:YXWGXW repeat-containing protein
MTRLRGLLLLSVVVLATALSSWAGVFVSVAVGPPALPVYSQPLCPGPGYIWTPGYWAYGPAGYYWVPGTWVIPPQAGFLWTPGYWAFSAGFYGWHPGYWGPTVGFYGGINYGFGYTGFGYWGGYWRGRDFYYNRAVNNVNITNIHNVYDRTVVNNYNVNRVSYNGGPGGIQARANSEQLAAERERHVGATSQQVRNEQVARSDRAQVASVNHGQPAVGATSRPGDFSAREATRANQPSVSRPTNYANAANNGRAVPRPPQSNQQSRASVNVPRPPQNSYSQQRAPQSVQRSSNYQEQARGSYNVPRPPQNNYSQQRAAANVARADNYTRQAAPQARYNTRPASMQRQAAPQYRAPSQHQGTSYRSAPSRAQQGGGRH